MKTDPEVDVARSSALGELHERLLAALELSERLDEFLLAAQIALALDTARGVLDRAGAAAASSEVGARAG